MIVLFGFDRGFAMPTGVAIRSLDRFLSSSDRIVLLHDQVPDDVVDRVAACASAASVDAYECSAMIDDRWLAPAHLTRAAYLRNLAPDLLPDESRCLYLDGDVVVRQDPAPLYEHDLAGTTLGAVRSRVAPFAASPGGIVSWMELGIPSAAPTFNSGVLLMDLGRWRQRDVNGSVTQFLARHGQTAYIADQEALNVAVVGDWTELERKWNYVTHVAESFLPQPELEPDPAIVHFAGRAKPWTHGRMPLFADDWYHHLAMTPWAGFRPTPPPPPTGPRAWVRRHSGSALRKVRDLAREQV